MNAQANIFCGKCGGVARGNESHAFRHGFPLCRCLLPEQSWAAKTWQRRSTAWLQQDERRDFRSGQRGDVRVYWFALPKWGITHIEARTLSQMDVTGRNK